MTFCINAPPTFGALLRFHLTGKGWNTKTFADRLGKQARTIRYWLSDEHLPTDFETIERVLFGNDPRCHAEWRLELREALTVGLQAARTSSRSLRARQMRVRQAVTTLDTMSQPTRPEPSRLTSVIWPQSA
jgi:hypothetical protein